jgi:hypothetical protein
MRNRKPNAKLNPEKVQAILLSDEPGKVLARRYGVTTNAISQIRHGKTWKDVPWPQEQRNALSLSRIGEPG